jgi:hypothetical protein
VQGVIYVIHAISATISTPPPTPGFLWRGSWEKDTDFPIGSIDLSEV